MTDEREETQEEYEERRDHDLAMSEFVDDFDARGLRNSTSTPRPC